MHNTHDLLKAAKDAEAKHLPKWVRELIGDLAHQLEAQKRYADSVRQRADEEVNEARKLAAEGPEGSDTFLSLPRALLGDEDDNDEKPLGKGVTVEFREETDNPGEGFGVRLTSDGHLHVSGINRLAIVPIDYLTTEIRKV